MLILAFPDYAEPAQRLARQLDAPLDSVFLHHFPDAESLIRLPASLPSHIIICRSLDHPNDKLIELLLCAETARELGAERITLVAPYLCYMRQDIANHPGEAVSQRIIGQLLGNLFDDVITVDPHLHRITHLNQAIPLPNAVSLSASPVMGSYLKTRFDRALLLGPDSESEQWVANIATVIGFEYAVAGKIRKGDRDIEITLPDRDFSNQPIVIIDDMASTGRTLARTIALLRAAGATEIYAAITHALFCDDAEAFIRSAGIKEIWSTDSIQHSTSCIRLDFLLSEAIRSIS